MSPTTDDNTKYAIEKMSDSFEITMDMMKDFLQIIADIKTKIAVYEKYYSDTDKKLDISINNSFEMLNMMKASPNDSIAKEVSSMHTTHTIEKSLLDRLKDDIDHLKNECDKLAKILIITESIVETTKETKTLYKVIAGIFAVITIVVGGFEVIRTLQFSDSTAKMKGVIEDLQKSAKIYNNSQLQQKKN
jgi:hypothetical protein